jgi:maltose-binding protein MalE
MSIKKKVLIIVFVIVLAITAGTATAESQQTATAENQQEVVSDNRQEQEEIFQFLGIIGERARYSVYRMTDEDNVCYIVLDEYVGAPGGSNSAPAIHCP